MEKNQVRFLIAARSFLNKEKVANPQINIYDHEVPKSEICQISKLTEAEAEEAAKTLEKSGLIHMSISDNAFDCCKVACVSFDKLDEFLLKMAQNK